MPFHRAAGRIAAKSEACPPGHIYTLHSASAGLIGRRSIYRLFHVIEQSGRQLLSVGMLLRLAYEAVDVSYILLFMPLITYSTGKSALA